MQRSLGTLVPSANVRSAADFFHRTFECFKIGPEVVRPKRIGSYEPLQPVQSADLSKILLSTYFLSNGRRMSAIVSPPFGQRGRFFNVSVHLEIAANRPMLADQAYEWLKTLGTYHFIYMGSPTPALFRDNLELHQMLERGITEQKLSRALELAGGLDRYEIAA